MIRRIVTIVETSVLPVQVFLLGELLHRQPLFESTARSESTEASGNLQFCVSETEVLIRILDAHVVEHVLGSVLIVSWE